MTFPPSSSLKKEVFYEAEENQYAEEIERLGNTNISV